MRILIAPDKFKGSLSARAVAENIAAGVRDVLPAAAIELAPVADGGEGTADVICQARAGQWRSCAAQDALGQPIEAQYVWLADHDTAVIEMSEAAGMRRLTRSDIVHATTFGVGEIMAHALEHGAREIVVGLGGSATNDGGFGMARALGFRFFSEIAELVDGPGELVTLTRIDPNSAVSARVMAAADVRNPLLGPNGATRTFGPQKGAAPEQLNLLERGLAQLVAVSQRDLGSDFQDYPGAGAAGGLGFGLLTFCRAELRPGFDIVAEAIELERKISAADVIITGEGRFDAQTLEGKAPAGVAKLAHRLNKPVYGIVGEASEEARTNPLFDGVYELARPPISRTAAIKTAASLLRDRAAELARTICR